MLQWCLAKKSSLKKISPDISRARAHLEKAKHNLHAVDYNIKGGFMDWAVSQSYYAMYHAMLAILFNFGFESRNHECTFRAVEYLIKTKKINLPRDSIAQARTVGLGLLNDAKSLREEYQYGVKTDLNPEIMENLIRSSKSIVEEVEIELTKN